MRKMLSDSILDLGKCPNRKMHESESAFFRLGHFARSKIESESIFLIKYYAGFITFAVEEHVDIKIDDCVMLIDT